MSEELNHCVGCDKWERLNAEGFCAACRDAAEIASLRQQLAATQRELARREGEILTIANGDRLHEDASENAHLAADYRDTLKRIGDNAKLERDEARRELEIRVAQVIEFRAEGDRMREERDCALALLRELRPVVSERKLAAMCQGADSEYYAQCADWLARLDALLKKEAK